MQISIIGTGYVGLVTGACFAEVGHAVWCIDNDEAKVANLKKGIVPIFEPGLEKIVRTNLERGSLNVTSDPMGPIENSDLIFIAVGTPPDEDGSADLQSVLFVAETIGKHMNGPKVIVDKSTVPVGTADKVRATIDKALKDRGADFEFHVCSNPEFLKEGNAVEDFRRPDRIIVGTDSAFVEARMRECYAPFNRSTDKIMVMDVRSAELTKYAANAMLATKISFINEMSRIAEKVGADIEQVRRGIGSDPRIGYHFIYPGAGYGGSCFPKDVQALARTAQTEGIEPILLKAVEAVNERQKETLFEKLNEALAGEIEGKTIAVWGLAFKPNTNDMRSAPSITLIEALAKAGAKIRGYDPEAGSEASRIFKNIDAFELSPNKKDAIAAADALVICTEWAEFRVVDFAFLKAQLSEPIVVDGRNLYDPQKAASEGVRYYSIGRQRI